MYELIFEMVGQLEEHDASGDLHKVGTAFRRVCLKSDIYNINELIL